MEGEKVEKRKGELIVGEGTGRGRKERGYEGLERKERERLGGETKGRKREVKEKEKRGRGMG